MKNLIDSLGISHRRFAELYSIPYRTVAAWYTGERTAPEWVKSLIVQIIELKTKGEQLTFENANQKAYLHYNNNELCYVYDNEEDAKKWKSFSMNICNVHNVKIYEIEYIITKEI